MRAAAEDAGAAVAESVGTTVGKIAAELRSKAVAGESDTAVANVAGSGQRRPTHAIIASTSEALSGATTGEATYSPLRPVRSRFAGWRAAQTGPHDQAPGTAVRSSGDAAATARRSGHARGTATGPVAGR